MNTRAFLGMSHSPLLGLNALPPDAERRPHDALAAMRSQVAADAPDPVVSHRMRVDHGFAQSLQLIWGSLDTPPVVPIFINAVAQPGIPRARRCRTIGEAMDRFLDTEPRRTLLIGSGGLSHEPPVPTMSNLEPAVRERITVRRESTPRQRAARMEYITGFGVMFLEQTQ